MGRTFTCSLIFERLLDPFELPNAALRMKYALRNPRWMQIVLRLNRFARESIRRKRSELGRGRITFLEKSGGE